MDEVLVADVAQVDELVGKIEAAAEQAAESVVAGRASGVGLLKAMKFDQLGRHPVEDRPLNIIEQVNQTFTYLVTCQAVRVLLELHPDSAPFRLNLGTRAGYDIESVDGHVVAEVFAAVSPKNNRKLAKDIVRVDDAKREHGYVFFYSPGFKTGRREDLEPGTGTVVWVVSV